MIPGALLLKSENASASALTFFVSFGSVTDHHLMMVHAWLDQYITITTQCNATVFSAERISFVVFTVVIDFVDYAFR